LYWLSYEHDGERGYGLRRVILGKNGLRRHVMQTGRNKMRARIEKRRGPEQAEKRADRITNVLDDNLPEEEDPEAEARLQEHEAEKAAKVEKAAEAAKAARAAKKAAKEAKKAAEKAAKKSAQSSASGSNGAKAGPASATP
ncbi:MAG: hypothetical protein ACREQJ_15150, partial [Candidatus Binatia bacterium]